MESICINKVGSEDILLKDHLFTLNGSHLRINSNNELVDFNLDQISNVRFSKKRNYSKNSIFSIISILIYSLLLFFFNLSILLSIVSTLLLIALVFMSFSIKNYTYLLLINVTNFGFRELKISKKKSLCAEYFVSVFKSEYFNEELHLNNLDFINCQHSS